MLLSTPLPFVEEFINQFAFIVVTLKLVSQFTDSIFNKRFAESRQILKLRF